MRFHVFHQEQADGTWVALCASLPGWLCFGDTLTESKDRAEWSLRDHLVTKVVALAHFEIPKVNHELRAAA